MEKNISRNFKETGYIWELFAVSNKDDNFGDFLFAFQHIKFRIEQGFILWGKNLLPDRETHFL